MARPRTPTNILAFKGANKKHPERAKQRANEPEVKAKFPREPPTHLAADQKKTWKEIKGLVPHGVLTGADVIVVELAAVLLAEFRADSGGMVASRLIRLEAQLGKLGLSPSDRAKLSVAKGNAGKFDDL